MGAYMRSLKARMFCMTSWTRILLRQSRVLLWNIRTESGRTPSRIPPWISSLLTWSIPAIMPNAESTRNPAIPSPPLQLHDPLLRLIA